MDYSKKNWNDDFKRMKALIKKEATFNEGKELMLFLHGMVHCSNVSEVDKMTLEDELWSNMSDRGFRKGLNKKGRTVAYGMWHTTRIEDMTMNLLVAGKTQVIDEGHWKEKVKSTIYSTGNELTLEEILDFSSKIDSDALRAYRKAVGIRTRAIISELSFEDFKRKILKDGLKKIADTGAVSSDENAVWLIDYWSNKTVSGILLMPATRHNLVHINESLEAKKKGEKL